MKTQTIQGKEGLWAKVLYDKFEGFVFMPFTQNYPPLNLNPNVARIYTCSHIRINLSNLTLSTFLYFVKI
jgi:hypothetical protein